MTSASNPLRGALLGLIAHRPMSGYDLAKVFDNTLANAWSAKHSQIYPELAAMVEAGLLSVREAGTRRRKEYRITARGKRELERWLVETPVEPRIARNEAVLRSFFLGFMPAADARAFLAGERRRHEEQLERFLAFAPALRERHPELRLHAANSAATLRDPTAHLDMVRCGVAVYGLDPFGEDPGRHGLEPALELRSHVADVKRFDAGDSAGYERTWRASVPTAVGVLPIGYGDGVRRALSNNGEVLAAGRRHPVVGTISMDNLTIDLGPEPAVAPGDPAVLIGSQQDERILCEELARRLGTINYEITCGISARVPREYVRSRAPRS